MTAVGIAAVALIAAAWVVLDGPPVAHELRRLLSG